MRKLITIIVTTILIITLSGCYSNQQKSEESIYIEEFFDGGVEGELYDKGSNGAINEVRMELVYITKDGDFVVDFTFGDEITSEWETRPKYRLEGMYDFDDDTFELTPTKWINETEEGYQMFGISGSINWTEVRLEADFGAEYDLILYP